MTHWLQTLPHTHHSPSRAYPPLASLGSDPEANIEERKTTWHALRAPEIIYTPLSRNKRVGGKRRRKSWYERTLTHDSKSASTEDKFQTKNCNCTQQLLQTKHLHTVGMWLEVWIRTQRWSWECFQLSGRQHPMRQSSKGDAAYSSISYGSHS